MIPKIRIGFPSIISLAFMFVMMQPILFAAFRARFIFSTCHIRKKRCEDVTFTVCYSVFKYLLTQYDRSHTLWNTNNRLCLVGTLRARTSIVSYSAQLMSLQSKRPSSHSLNSCSDSRSIGKRCPTCWSSFKQLLMCSANACFSSWE